VAQGTTGHLLAKSIFQKAKLSIYQEFPSASMSLLKGDADAVLYDEPGIQMFELMNKQKVKKMDKLITKENLGIAVKRNDFETVQWLNSFLASYRGSIEDIQSQEKWFKNTDWMDQI